MTFTPVIVPFGNARADARYTVRVDCFSQGHIVCRSCHESPERTIFKEVSPGMWKLEIRHECGNDVSRSLPVSYRFEPSPEFMAWFKPMLGK